MFEELLIPLFFTNIQNSSTSNLNAKMNQCSTEIFRVNFYHVHLPTSYINITWVNEGEPYNFIENEVRILKPQGVQTFLKFEYTTIEGEEL